MMSLKRFKRLRKFFVAHSTNYSHHVVDLRAPLLRRSPFIAGLLVIIVVSSIYGTRLLFTRADAIDFNPTSCLGTWQSPHLAQGQPQSINNSLDTITPSNSAIWYGGEKNIFCGNFIPSDFEPRGTITDVGLTLIWSVGIPDITPTITETVFSENSSSTEPNSSSTTSTSTTLPTATSTTSSIINASKTSSTTKTNSTTTTPATKPSTTKTTSTSQNSSTTLEKASSTSFWQKFIPLALAQETTSTDNSTAPAEPIASPDQEVIPIENVSAPPVSITSTTTLITTTTTNTTPPATTSTKAVVTSTEKVDEVPAIKETSPKPKTTTSTTTTTTGNDSSSTIELPPIIATINDSTSSPATGTSTIAETSTPQIIPDAPNENFLNVSISLDGTNWEEVGQVNENNWQHFTASLSINNWEDLKNLQIKVESIDSTNISPPPVLLDGMFIEVKYTTLSFLELSDNVTSDDVILLPTTLRGEKTQTNPNTIKTIASFFNPKYAEIISPESYDERRTIWFGWCGVMTSEVGNINVCDDASEPIIEIQEDALLTVGMGRSSSNINYSKSSNGVHIEMNLINDGWWDSTSTQPVDLILEYPEKLSLSNDGTILYLDQGSLEIKTPPGYNKFSITTSSIPGFKKAVYSFEFESLPLGDSRQIILDLWKR